MTTSEPVPIQLGMLGVPACIEDHHVVHAHTRLLTGGGEVFVAEHLRQNRGRQAPGHYVPRPRTAEPPSRQQPWLFPVATPEPVTFEEFEPATPVRAPQLSFW